MRGFSVKAFSMELANIKVAQAEMSGDAPGRKRWKEIAKVLAQNVGAGVLGAGLGTGLGYSAGELIRRSSLSKSMTPAHRRTLHRVSGVIGGAGGMALLHALSLAQKRVEAVPR